MLLCARAVEYGLHYGYHYYYKMEALEQIALQMTDNSSVHSASVDDEPQVRVYRVYINA